MTRIYPLTPKQASNHSGEELLRIKLRSRGNEERGPTGEYVITQVTVGPRALETIHNVSLKPVAFGSSSGW